MGLMTSKVLPSTALTNLLLMNNPVLRRLAKGKYFGGMDWVFTVVRTICRSEVESARVSQQLVTNVKAEETYCNFRHVCF